MRTLGSMLALLAVPAIAWAGEQTVTLAVENMTCATCPVAVRSALKRVPGVKDVAVDFDRKIAVVVFDDGLATPEKLAAASRSAGFPATPKQ
jgi:mercuric ion binding protein